MGVLLSGGAALSRTYRSRARARYYSRVYRTRCDGGPRELLADVVKGLLIGVPVAVLIWVATLWLVFR